MTGSMAYQQRDAGNEAYQSGNYILSLEKHQKAVAINPEDPGYHTDLANTLLAIETVR